MCVCGGGGGGGGCCVCIELCNTLEHGYGLGPQVVWLSVHLRNALCSYVASSVMSLPCLLRMRGCEKE